MTAKEFLHAKKTFYAKKRQNNKYYPIYKFVWNERENAWEQFAQKENGWHSYGFGNKNGNADNIQWFLYIFEHNSYILSYNEMKDDHNYNDK